MTSVNRISGMVSGLDTDTLVKKMMTAESINLNKMKQNQQKYTWQSDGYRQWNSDLFAFRSNTLFNMKLSSNYNTYSTTSSNPDSMSGVSTAEAVQGSYSYQISHLAQSATIKSDIDIDQTAALGIATELTITTKDQTGASYTTKVSVAATDKIGDVITKLNAAKDNTTGNETSGKSMGLKAIYDSTLKQFILKTKDTGAKTEISLSSSNASFLDSKLGLSVPGAYVDKANGFSGSNGTYVTAAGNTNPNLAQDAMINFNDKDVTSTSNNIKIMGVNYTLKNVTTAPQTVTITSDVDAEVKNIKDFVSKYNEMLDKLNKAVNETVYKDYQPLTDDQREAMSETQITTWETKAKSGLFHNDSSLKQLISSMRNHMTAAVDNGSEFNSLASIGISSKSYQDKGKLYIDETKLRAAIQADPEAVKNLFSQSPSDTTTNVKQGLVVRLYDDFQTAFTKIKDKAGSAGSTQFDQSVIGKLMSKTYKDINSETDRLSQRESNYYKKFTAMETAMNNYNSQSSYLSSQLSSSRG